MPWMLIGEITGALLSLLYLIFLVQENKWCWLFGITSSLLSVFLFVESKLYSESILYSFYVLMGVYGWVQWSKPTKKIKIGVLKGAQHLLAICIGVLGTLGLGWFWKTYSDAEQAYADAFSTSFGFVATFLEAHKVLHGWFYWIVLNAFSVWLYASRGMTVYPWLMVLYTVLSVMGYLNWKKKHQLQKTADIL